MLKLTSKKSGLWLLMIQIESTQNPFDELVPENCALADYR